MSKDIINKINALLAKASEENNPSEAERDQAMKMAQALLAKHNLSPDDLIETDLEIGETRVEIRTGPWSRQMWSAVAKLYFSKCLFTRGKHQRCWVYGEEINAKVAVQIGMWVQEALWKEGLRVRAINGGHNAHLTSFLNMAALKLSERVDQMIREAISTGIVDPDTGGTALVPMSAYEEAWAAAEEAFPPDVKTRKTKMQVRSAAGAAAGEEFASKLNLGRQVGATRQAMNLLS